MTFTPFHQPGCCPVCDRQRQATADVPPVRLLASTPVRRWFEAAVAERWLAT